MAALAPASEPGVAYGDGVGSLTISPTSGKVGTTFHVHGTGFVNFSLITHQLDLSVSDTNIDTSDGKYASGTYTLLASYTYWGTRRDALQNVICSFCPVKTVPLADLATFTLQ